MRIPQNFAIHSLLEQINSLRERIYTHQRNISTGKRINKLSDDPEKIETVLRYHKLLKLNERFENNIDSALDYMHYTSQVLDDMAQVLIQVKELTVKGLDDIGPDAYGPYVQQLNELLKKLVNLANSRFRDHYIFAGTSVKDAPFTLAADLSQVDVTATHIDDELKVEIGDGRIDRYNVTGQEAFLEPVNVFQAVIDIRNAFEQGDQQQINANLPQLEKALDQVLRVNSRLGAQINRFQLLRDQYSTADLRIQEFLSRIEDTDMARAITELQMEQTSLEASLRALSKTMNISLLDYL